MEHVRTLLSLQDRETSRLSSQKAEQVLEASLKKAASVDARFRTQVTAAVHILTDLAQQGWNLRINGDEVLVRLPDELVSDPLMEKARVRKQELLKRDEQLATPSVRKFIRAMEKKRLHGGSFVSIFSLMRDGRGLAEALLKIREAPQSERTSRLKDIVDPYIQFVSEAALCEHTGLRLMDIWRYFRHTWTNQYTSIPGRTMMFLVRDRAASFHPVVGIGALGSPIVQIKERDAWIGWHPAAFLDHANEHPSADLGDWLLHVANVALAEIYSEDFVEEQTLSVNDLRRPTAEIIQRLRQMGAKERGLHHRYSTSREHKGSKLGNDPEGSSKRWVEKARTHLFRSKRALSLADLLRARMTLGRYLGSHPTAESVSSLLADRSGRQAAATVLRKAKADRIGIAVADITVCGAIPPYNPLLGGKLLAMLAASPEVVGKYRARYETAESEIASSMAGRPIVRPADLVLLGTTSLYGVGSSQYNRVRIPASRLGGLPTETIRYLELGRSQAFGTSHFSNNSVNVLADLVQQSRGGQRVNSIFGEGVSPKLRKIRQGLEELGFPSEHLLRHGRSRIVYGVSLVQNLREYLLGIESEPRYLFSTQGPEATAAIADWWRERWLAMRIGSDGVLADVARHSLARPIRHGARVVLPPSESSVQLTMFDDLWA